MLYALVIHLKKAKIFIGNKVMGKKEALAHPFIA
jgi:hypothetical protein